MQNIRYSNNKRYDPRCPPSVSSYLLQWSVTASHGFLKQYTRTAWAQLRYHFQSCNLCTSDARYTCTRATTRLTTRTQQNGIQDGSLIHSRKAYTSISTQLLASLHIRTCSRQGVYIGVADIKWFVILVTVSC